MVASCYSQSTSVPHGHSSLTMIYVWYFGTRKIINNRRYHLRGNQLCVTNITKKDDRLEIICAAEETSQLPSDNSSAYRIAPEYSPGSVTLSPSNVSYTLLEIADSLGPIHCISDCNPNCTYNWRRDGTNVANGPVLLVNKIVHEHAGTYSCKATNKYNTQGQVSPTFSVLVEYAPVNTSLSSSVGHIVNETTTITFECITESVPNSTLQLMYQGNDTKYLQSENSTVKSAYKILRANCLDTGKYFCTATNKRGSSVSDKIDLKVLFTKQPENNFIFESATGGISVLLVIVIMVIVHMFRKRRKDKKGDGTQVINNSGKNIEEENHGDEMKSNVIYQTTGPDNEQQFQVDGPIYINTQKSIKDRNNRKRNNACTVTKKTDPGINLLTKKQATRKTAREDGDKNVGCARGIHLKTSEDVYENSETKKRPKNISSCGKNKDGLIYIDIEFNGAGKDKGEVINHRINKRNNYAEIDLTMHASPPPTSHR